MNAYFFTPLLFGLLLLPSAPVAAEPEDPPPEPPFVARVPDNTCWTITTTSKPASSSAESKEAPFRFETKICRSGHRRREFTKYPNGPSVEKFSVAGFSFIKRSGFAAGDVMVQPSGSPDTDFPELSWLSLENYIGTKKIKGEKYQVYAYSPAVLESRRDAPPKVLQPAQAGGAAGRLTITAWIDMTTRLPVRMTSSKGERTYKFSPSSPRDIEPSPDIRKRIEAYFNGKIPQ